MTFYNHEILKILKAGGIDALIVRVEQRNQFLISLFDDEFFTQADFDIIDGKTRSMMTALLKKSGYDLKGSRHFIAKDGKNFYLAKPSHTLGCNPADKVMEAFSEGSFLFCTPTQALLVLLACGEKLEDQFLKDFLHRQPVNVKKLFQWIRHDNIGWESSFKEIDIQNICDEGKILRKNRELSEIHFVNLE